MRRVTVTGREIYSWVTSLVWARPRHLRALLDGRYPETRDRVRWWLSQPGNEPADDLPLEEHRERVLAWARELSAEGDTAMGYPVEYGGQGSPARSVTAFETLAMGDLSLLVKCGVQFGLFGGAILHLGTERHHERYLRDVASLELPGCFAMTETGHGSNVQALETTATYDAAREEFVIHTPHDDARKDYIGNAARDGRMAVVFAQLIAGGSERGVHAVLVPIRDEDGDAAARRPDRGLRREARPQRRRQRAHVVRPRARPAREPARPLRAGSSPTGPTSARSRTRPSASSRCSGR